MQIIQLHFLSQYLKPVLNNKHKRSCLASRRPVFEVWASQGWFHCPLWSLHFPPGGGGL